MLKFLNIRNVLIIIFIGFSTHAVYAGQKTGDETATLVHRILLLDAASKDGTSILVGERGLIFVSRDNNPWQMIQLPIPVTLTAVFLQNKNLGWVVGHDAVIFRTEDGGETWQQVYAAPEEEAPLLDIWFRNETYGIAIGAYGLYLKTTDGGSTWTREDMPVTTIKTAGKETINESHRSDDLAEYYDLHLNAVARSDDGKIYLVAEAGRIYRSIDQGENWQQLPSPYIGSLFGVLPLEKNTLLVFGLRGHLFRSEDAGNTWKKIETHTDRMLTNGTVLHDGKIIIVGMEGTILLSNDYGNTFSVAKEVNRNNYSALVEDSNNRLILTGDHGLESYTREELGISDE